VYGATLPLDITRKSDIHRQQSRHVPLHFDGDRKCFLAARSRRRHATGLMDHLADVEVAIWAVRNHRLARLEEQEDILAIGDPDPPEAHAHAPAQPLDV